MKNQVRTIRPTAITFLAVFLFWISHTPRTRWTIGLEYFSMTVLGGIIMGGVISTPVYIWQTIRKRRGPENTKRQFNFIAGLLDPISGKDQAIISIRMTAGVMLFFVLYNFLQSMNIIGRDIVTKVPDLLLNLVLLSCIIVFRSRLAASILLITSLFSAIVTGYNRFFVGIGPSNLFVPLIYLLCSSRLVVAAFAFCSRNPPEPSGVTEPSGVKPTLYTEIEG